MIVFNVVFIILILKIKWNLKGSRAQYKALRS